MDAKILEDMEFDRLIGKSTLATPISEKQILSKLNLPFITKMEEQKIVEQTQSIKLDSKVLNSYMYSEQFRMHCHRLKVVEHKEIHERLQQLPPVPEFNQPQRPEEKEEDMTEDPSFSNENRVKPKKHYRDAELTNEQSAPSERNSETDEHPKIKNRSKPLKRERPKNQQVDGQTSNHEESSMPTLEQTKETKEEKKPIIESKVQKITAMEIIKKNLDQVQVNQRRHQMVGLNQIKLITKMIYLQKKELGLRLSGDQVIEKQVKKNYID